MTGLRNKDRVARAVKLLFLAAAVAALAAPLLSCTANRPSSGAAATTPPTFHERIEPILQNHCQPCHRRGGNAPFSLVEYDEVRAKSRTLARVVREQQMPPWGANPEHGKFLNDISLSQSQIETLLHWVEAGSPRGDPVQAPPPRKFSADWEIGVPDATFSTPPFEVPAEGRLPYRYVRMRTHFPDDRWVQAMQIRSTASELVHHVLIFLEDVRPPPPGVERPWRPPFNPFRLLEGAAPQDYPLWIQRYRNLIRRDLRVGTAGGMDGYFVSSSSGNLPTVYPEGRAKLLPAGATLVFQIHYTPLGKTQISQTTLALRFAQQPPQEAVDTSAIATVAFVIPPGAPSHTVQATTRFLRDGLLLSLNPHMHLRGKSFRYIAEFPDGRREILLDVPRYDFNWQLDYIFDKPRLLPRGTVLRAVATYDNSPANPQNPDPNKEVYFGLQTEDEMLIGYYSVVWKGSADDFAFAP